MLPPWEWKFVSETALLGNFGTLLASGLPAVLHSLPVSWSKRDSADTPVACTELAQRLGLAQAPDEDQVDAPGLSGASESAASCLC